MVLFRHNLPQPTQAQLMRGEFPETLCIEQGVVLSCRFAESKVRWISRVLWMAVEKEMLCWTAFLSLRSGFSLVQFVSHPPTLTSGCVFIDIIVLVFLIGHVAVAVTTAFLFS